jgi:hypothetical protein
MTDIRSTKRCGKCRETKAIDCFAKNARSTDGRQGMCRMCFKAYKVYGAYDERLRHRDRGWLIPEGAGS